MTFEWDTDGCANGRTQYGRRGATWSRVFVPDASPVVSVNSYDPESRTYRIDRYLLDRAEMEAARAARDSYKAPACAVPNAAAMLGDRQGSVLADLPEQPNERLVYECQGS